MGVRPFQRPLTFSSKSTSTCLAEQFGVDLADDLFLQIVEHVEAAAFFFVGDVIVHAAGGNGIRSGRVTCQMSDIQFQVREEAVGFHELFLCFAGESDDDVGRDGTVRDAFADLCDEVAVVLLGVSALHVVEHGIVTGLNGDFDVRHELGKVGDGVHQIVVEVVGVRGQEADALDALDFVHQAQQAGQVGAIGDVFAVAVYDLTEQGDFFDALFCQRADFGDNIADGTAALDAAFVGDDAVGAGVRAAVDDRDMRADQFAPARGRGASVHRPSLRSGAWFRRFRGSGSRPG